jgi:hypothetical protein
MKLEVHERLAILAILPGKSDYAALKTIRRAREMLSFTPEEQEFYVIKQVVGPDGNTSTTWNSERAREKIKDCPVDEYTTHLIRDILAEKNMKKELTEQYVSLFEKFVLAYQ